ADGSCFLKAWRLFRLAGGEADGKMADLRAPGISPGALNSYSPRNPVVTLGPGSGNTFRDELREHRPERRNPVSCSIRANRAIHVSGAASVAERHRTWSL